MDGLQRLRQHVETYLLPPEAEKLGGFDDRAKAALRGALPVYEEAAAAGADASQAASSTAAAEEEAEARCCIICEAAPREVRFACGKRERA